MKKSILIVGTLAYFVMALLAILFYKERIGFMDSSYILFSLLKDGALAIQVNRFGVAVTQMVPLICAKLGMTLESITKVYSLSFVLFYFTIFLTCFLVLKKEKFALAVLLFNVMMVTHTFFWVVPEFQQGLAMLILYFAFILRMEETGRYENVWVNPVNILLIFTLAFMHPLMIFPFAFFIGYFYFFSSTNKSMLLKNALIYLGFFVFKDNTEYFILK